MPRHLSGPRAGGTAGAAAAAGVIALLVASPLASAAPSPSPAAGSTVQASARYTCHARDVTMTGTLTVAYVQPDVVAQGEDATFALPHGTWTVAPGSIPGKYQGAAMFVTPRLEADGAPGPFVDALISGPTPIVGGGYALTRPIAITPLSSDRASVTLALPKKMTVQATLTSGTTPNNRSFTCTSTSKKRTLSTIAFDAPESATPSESASPSETATPSETASPTPSASPSASTPAAPAPAPGEPGAPLADTGAGAGLLPFLVAGGVAAAGGATALTLSRKGRR